MRHTLQADNLLVYASPGILHDLVLHGAFQGAVVRIVVGVRGASSHRLLRGVPQVHLAEAIHVLRRVLLDCMKLVSMRHLRDAVGIKEDKARCQGRRTMELMASATMELLRRPHILVLDTLARNERLHEPLATNIWSHHLSLHHPAKVLGRLGSFSGASNAVS